jgi:hypothetical protein
MLISRMSRALTGEHARPALFGEEIARDLNETMRFRHRVRHSAYDDFEPVRAEPAIAAVRRLLTSVRPAIKTFRDAIDPD